MRCNFYLLFLAVASYPLFSVFFRRKSTYYTGMWSLFNSKFKNVPRYKICMQELLTCLALIIAVRYNRPRQTRILKLMLPSRTVFKVLIADIYPGIYACEIVVLRCS